MAGPTGVLANPRGHSLQLSNSPEEDGLSALLEVHGRSQGENIQFQRAYRVHNQTPYSELRTRK